MKPINTAYKPLWVVKVLLRNTKRTCSKKTLQNLTDNDTYKNIHLIQTFMHHDYCKIISKGHYR